jgi:hypothetical protein
MMPIENNLIIVTTSSVNQRGAQVYKYMSESTLRCNT